MSRVQERSSHARNGNSAPELSDRPDRCDRGYDPVLLRAVKTAISVPDDTFRRVDDAAKRLGVSRSEFFARAAERWLASLDDDGTTDAINRVVGGLRPGHQFTDTAAAALAAGEPRE